MDHATKNFLNGPLMAGHSIPQKMYRMNKEVRQQRAMQRWAERAQRSALFLAAAIIVSMTCALMFGIVA